MGEWLTEIRLWDEAAGLRARVRYRADMTYFTRSRFALAALVLTGGLLSDVFSIAWADGSEATTSAGEGKVEIISGFETSAFSDRTRTIIRKRQRGNDWIIDRRYIALGGSGSALIAADAEEDVETDEASEAAEVPMGDRAATGRSPEVELKGVRIINKR